MTRPWTTARAPRPLAGIETGEVASNAGAVRVGDGRSTGRIDPVGQSPGKIGPAIASLFLSRCTEALSAVAKAMGETHLKGF